jgi:hypothetical protein
MKNHVALSIRVSLAFVGLTFLSSLAAAAPSSLQYQRACERADDTLIIASVGDVLAHAPLQRQAYGSRKGFVSLWEKVEPWLSQPDLTYGNLEGPTAAGVTRSRKLVADPGPVYDDNVYTGSKFIFNYHPRIISDLKDTGFDILSVANNHSLDRGVIGIDKTVDAFAEAQMPSVGIRRSDDQRSPRHTIIEKKGFRIAFVACTEATNGFPNPAGQVLFCYKDVETVLAEIRNLAKDQTLDAIIVTPHWGVEYKLKPSSYQTSYAQKFLEAGATAVIGSHPHVLQPIQRYVTRDGRETFIAYSLGNFVSNQFRMVSQKLSAIVYLGLSRSSGKKAWINGVSYIPTYMERRPLPLGTNLLEVSSQAPRNEAHAVLKELFDRTRELRASDPISTNFECLKN